MILKIGFPRIEILADVAGRSVKAGQEMNFEMFSLGVPANEGLTDAGAVTRLLQYLQNPQGLRLVRGTRAASPGLIECGADDGAVEVIVPKPDWRTRLTLPLRVTGLNPRWTAGLLQKKGYVLGIYGSGTNRYRELAVDESGNAYVPLYVDRADHTHVVAGHPIVADGQGRDLFIAVMHLRDQPARWHVAVNNPTDQPITARLRQTMALPGLTFASRTLTFQPGQRQVLLE